jgi:hypothetical protein
MAWGNAGNINTTNLDSAADDPSLAREDLYNALIELLAVINGRGAANGVATLDANSLVPAAQLPDTIESSLTNNLILAPDTGRVAVQNIINLTPQTVAELEGLTGIEGDVAFCSDGDAGVACLAVYGTSSDGSTVGWNRIPFGAIISGS